LCVPSRDRLPTSAGAGYTDNRIEQHGVLEDGLRFLRKLFTPDEIARALREALD